MRALVFAALSAILLGGCAAEGAEPEQSQMGKPEPALELTGRVVDAADILSPDFEEQMTAILADLEEDTRVQLVVATTPDLNGYEIETYSLNLARAWGLGDKARDDGLLLVVAPNERQLRIDVGYGLEASVEDEEAGEIIREVILPHFENGNYEAGISAGVDRLIEEVTPYDLKVAA
ncbi:MAG: TPM domain-containing protein [Pseudomonadota bacterium]